jgi:hypothetical protein
MNKKLMRRLKSLRTISGASPKSGLINDTTFSLPQTGATVPLNNIYHRGCFFLFYESSTTLHDVVCSVLHRAQSPLLSVLLTPSQMACYQWHTGKLGNFLGNSFFPTALNKAKNNLICLRIVCFAYFLFCETAKQVQCSFFSPKSIFFTSFRCLTNEVSLP